MRPTASTSGCVRSVSLCPRPRDWRWTLLLTRGSRAQFHLPCVGLKSIPDGRWFCDECRVRRSTRLSRSRRHATDFRCALFAAERQVGQEAAVDFALLSCFAATMRTVREGYCGSGELERWRHRCWRRMSSMFPSPADPPERAAEVAEHVCQLLSPLTLRSLTLAIHFVPSQCCLRRLSRPQNPHAASFSPIKLDQPTTFRRRQLASLRLSELSQ